jgi:uncharacterized protein (TIGR02996 family)
VTERDALLAEIEENPAEDGPRGAYADLLEEYPTDDLAAATAEFVRVSCGRTAVKGRQTRDEGRWLEANWQRLVPTLDVVRRYHPRRSGRWVSFAITVPDARQAGLLPTSFGFFLRAEFWRGFVRRVVFDGAFDLEIVLPHLLASQPLAEPDLAHPVAIGGGLAVGDAFLYRAEMGAAFNYLPGVLDAAREGHPHLLRVENDPTGKVAAGLRRDAFRTLAKALRVRLSRTPSAPQEAA